MSLESFTLQLVLDQGAWEEVLTAGCGRRGGPTEPAGKASPTSTTTWDGAYSCSAPRLSGDNELAGARVID